MKECRIKIDTQLSAYHRWEAEYGEIIPPSLSQETDTSAISTIDWQDDFTGPWQIHDFKVDKISGCSDGCYNDNSIKFVRRISSSMWVGAIFCNNNREDEYKIMLSDSIDGVFRHIIYPSTKQARLSEIS